MVIFLRTFSLVLARRTFKHASSVAKGRVISQSVPAGTQLTENSTVDLVVSKGKAPPKVTICYRRHTLHVTNKVAATLRKHGARLGACKKKRL